MIKNNKNLPRVSIITVCFNSIETIEDTFKSVLNQNYNNLEYIVIDGLSTDGTVQIIEKYKQNFVDKNITFLSISERDNGLYDAMNKGIKMSTGELIGILNSDDIYIDDEVISDVVNCFSNNNNIEAVYSDLVYVTVNNLNKIKRYWRSGLYNTKKIYYGWMLPHPTFFLSKKVYQKYGNYDLRFPVAADYEFILRVLLKFKIKVSYLNRVTIKMRLGGTSNATLNVRKLSANENKNAWAVNSLNIKSWTILYKILRKTPQYIFPGTRFRFIIWSKHIFAKMHKFMYE